MRTPATVTLDCPRQESTDDDSDNNNRGSLRICCIATHVNAVHEKILPILIVAQQNNL